MKKRSNMEKISIIILIVWISLILFGGIKLYLIWSMPNSIENRMNFMQDPQNCRLNTTDEKNNNIPFQIENGILYYTDDPNGSSGFDQYDLGFFQYDYSTKEKKKLFGGFVMDFKIIDNKVYYLNRSNMNMDRVANRYNLSCRDLEDIERKETIIYNISKCVFYKNDIIFSRFENGVENIYQYSENAEPERILSIDEDFQDKKRPWKLTFMLDDCLVFVRHLAIDKYTDGFLSVYNIKTGQWDSCFDINLKEEELYFSPRDIQAADSYVYIQGPVCDSSKPDIVVPYTILDNAEESGVWEVNIKTGEQRQLTKKVYYDGIYILDHALYGLDNGKYEKIIEVGS